MKDQKFGLIVAALVALGLVLSAGEALGEERRIVVQGEEKLRDVSLTISPLHLLLPTVEVTGELRAADSLGLAAVLGVGSITVEEDTFTVFEAGGQFRYYAIGDFDEGLQLGVETLYVEVSSENIGGSDVSGLGLGLALGPFVGYKYTSDLGFTFDSQLGFQHLFLQAEATAKSTGERKEQMEEDFIALLNLNIGWSF